MKTVIFVGGSSYSGSTLFCLTLANDRKGFSTGEVQHLFHPVAERHANFETKCGCGDPNCHIWHQVKAAGEKNVFTKLFELMPEVEFIVDSSKNPLWIDYHSKILRQQGIAVKNILMWKTPLEFARSCEKRGILDQWEKMWVTYHRLYRTLIPEPWRSIPYKEYTTDPTALARVCDFLEIPYFEEKKEYWNKTHHVLGGNHSARIHLYSPESKQYAQAKSNLPDQKQQAAPELHKKVYYRSEEDEAFRTAVLQQVEQSPYIDPILKMLDDHRLTAPAPTQSNGQALALSKVNVELRKINQQYKFLRGQLKFG